MTKYLIFFILLTISSLVKAQESLTKHKLTRDGFLYQFAAEDTTLQDAINLYFDHRKKATNKILAAPLGLCIAAGSLLLNSQTNNEKAKGLTSFGILFGSIGSIIGIPYLINGIKTLKKYKRKDLYLAIMQIKAGEMSSQDFYHKIVAWDVRK